MQRLALLRVAEHIVSVSDRRGDLGYELYALAHEVVPGNVVRILVEGVEFQNAPGQDVHDVAAFQFNDVQNGLMLQGHVVPKEILEGDELFAVGQSAGEQEISDFLETEAALFYGGGRKIGDFVASVIEAAVDGDQIPAFISFITYDVANIGKTGQHARAVLVSESALNVQAFEELRVDLGGVLHFVGQFAD